jgi:7-cyano-7-deazaguanine synthase in queuosine biosynthesis
MEGILVPISGGIESTYCLQKALETELPVCVHHINLIDYHMRYVEEKHSCYFIMNYFKEKGYNFNYTESTVDFSMSPDSVPFDEDVVIFMLAKIAEGIPYDVLTVYDGSNKDDLEKESVKKRWELRGDVYEFFHNCHYNVGERVQHVNIEMPCKDLTKKEIWFLLDEELRNMTWSCRSPFLREPCGKCEPCIERSQFNDETPISG